LVQADAAIVETHGTGVGTVFDEQRVVDLALNGGQVYAELPRQNKNFLFPAK
jgi:hypothetical protein